MYKLVAADLDDTLLRSDHTISERTVNTIMRLREKGITFTLATGRMYVAAKKYVEQLGICDKVIVYNGAMVVDGADGKTVFSKKMPLELAQEVLRIAEENNIYVQIFIDSRCYTAYESVNREIYFKHTGVMPEMVGDLKKFLRECPTKLLYIGEPEQIQKLYKSLGEHFAGKLELTVSKPNYLEFVDNSATKGNALKDLAESMGIKREEIMAFGDSYNDISMLKYAHMGVAMGNGFDCVKEVADLVGPSNDEDGVARVIEKYVLKECEK